MNNPALDYIKNRLSLRVPQSDSLSILDDVIDNILNKSTEESLKYIKNKYSYFNNYDRDFPSLCFSLATGVGKTRLMGAFVAYLYITKSIKNFIIIAPNITIYDKLIKDFSDESSEKYVFKGLKEFIQNKPKIVTGENYKEQGKATIWESDITINIFNIDKINKETQSIKSLSEWLGQSYYDYLSDKKDLVILMDESHHYRADRGMTTLNELKPILGLELTATPQVEKSGRTIKFNNIIYDYPLSKALIDGYVKNPFVATKKNFNSDNFNDDELDKMKLFDGLAIHENTKVGLEEYSKVNDVKLVKPFTMVICKSIEHANAVLSFIKSDEFYDGRYKDKVMLITSKDGKTEKDENVQRLLMLEHPLNPIEIVVHVNMLKEGWDVTNLYTIIPLRRSASQTLTEQTMGRGLRLPYGQRTGNDIVDGLTIVAHDKYQELVDEAHKETSIFKAQNIIYVEDMDLKEKEVVSNESIWEDEFNKILTNESSDIDKAEVNVKKEIVKAISNNKPNKSIDFTNQEIKKEIINKVTENSDIDKKEIDKKYDEFVNNIDSLIKEINSNKINIPYVTINSHSVITQHYADFTFNYDKVMFKPLDNSIIIRHLDDGLTFEIESNGNYLQYADVKELLFERISEEPSLNYEECAELIDHKVNEYLELLRKHYSEDEIVNIIYNYSKYISKEFARQFNSNMEVDNNLSEVYEVYDYAPILKSNYTKYKSDDILNYTDSVPKNEIRNRVFSGFKKAYHNIYKFDSNSEKELSIVLENSKEVIKWLRPAEKQFNIFYNNGINRYEPDFVVETNDNMYMIEVKKESDIFDDEVQKKKEAAEKYCEIINNHIKGKKWKYIIIPHTDIKTSYGFDRYI